MKNKRFLLLDSDLHKINHLHVGIIIFSLIILNIVLVSSAHAEPFLKPVNEKYTIIKNVGWAQWWPDSIKTAEVTIVDSRNSTAYQSGIKNLDIMVTDFVATSKGRASNSANILSPDLITISSVDPSDNTIVERSDGTKVINLSENLTRFNIGILSDGKDTVTYSGKIIMKNESVLVSVPVEVVIQHDVIELIVTTLVGIMSGIGIACILVLVILKNYLVFTKDKPWVSTALITIVSVPSSVFVNTVFIGSNGWDIVIALSIGLLVIAKLIAPKEKPNNKDKISLEFIPDNVKGDNKKLLDEILGKIKEFLKDISNDNQGNESTNKLLNTPK